MVALWTAGGVVRQSWDTGFPRGCRSSEQRYIAQSSADPARYRDSGGLERLSEEVNYRVNFLATLDGVISRRYAILFTAAYFGLGHFYGVPYGIVGVMMAGFLGWLLGKA